MEACASTDTHTHASRNTSVQTLHTYTYTHVHTRTHTYTHPTARAGSGAGIASQTGFTSTSHEQSRQASPTYSQHNARGVLLLLRREVQAAVGCQPTEAAQAVAAYADMLQAHHRVTHSLPQDLQQKEQQHALQDAAIPRPEATEPLHADQAVAPESHSATAPLAPPSPPPPLPPPPPSPQPRPLRPPQPLLLSQLALQHQLQQPLLLLCSSLQLPRLHALYALLLSAHLVELQQHTHRADRSAGSYDDSARQQQHTDHPDEIAGGYNSSKLQQHKGPAEESQQLAGRPGKEVLDVLLFEQPTGR